MRMKFCSSLHVNMLVAIIWAAIGSAADDCLPWTDSTYGYSVCLPSGWYHRTMSSGALFLCDDRQGACTTPVGGGPLLDHATASLLPMQIVLEEPPHTLAEFAHQVGDKEASSKFSDVMSIKGDFGAIRYLVVTQTYTTGARNDLPQFIYRYFAQANAQMIELILTFNSGDKRSQECQNTALKILASLHPK